VIKRHSSIDNRRISAFSWGISAIKEVGQKRKGIGGDQNYQPSGLVDILHPATYYCLMEARLDLTKQLGLRPGPDLGFQGKSENIAYLPAHQRYDGVIYQAGHTPCMNSSTSPPWKKDWNRGPGW